MVKITKEDALLYHESGRPGKIEVKPTKAYRTQTDLSLAYSPGVAYPCLEIQQDANNAYKYTDKGNLVAVISNGTAVLGLGDIGAVSGKPVMEGKGLLFKIYGGIDVFDIEVDEKDPRDARRPARHRHHLSCRTEKRFRGKREGHQEGKNRSERSRCRCHQLHQTLYGSGRTKGEHRHARLQGCHHLRPPQSDGTEEILCH